MSTLLCRICHNPLSNDQSFCPGCNKIFRKLCEEGRLPPPATSRTFDLYDWRRVMFLRLDKKSEGKSEEEIEAETTRLVTTIHNARLARIEKEERDAHEARMFDPLANYPY